MFFVGVALAFVVLHSFLFLFHRKERGNLYLACAALGFALLELGNAVRDIGQGPIRLWSNVSTVGVAVMILSFIRFGHHFNRQRRPLTFAFFATSLVVAVAWHAITDSFVLPRIIALVSLLELIRLLVSGSRQRAKSRHNWLIGLGFLCILLTAAFDTLSDLGVLPLGGGSYPFGMLFLFLCLSIYLSWEVADTHRDLEQKLIEVHVLSEQKLEEERLRKQQEIEKRLLERDHERQREELEAARRLQLSLLPTAPPDIPELEIDFAMRTASEVGGDYYDYRQADDGSLFLVIGDATGHGLDAGLLVGATKGLFHAAPLDDGVTAVLESLRSGLVGLGLTRMFMALALIRYSEGQLEVVTAGMPPLLLASERGTVEELSVGAPPLGTLGSNSYRPLRTRFAPGETLLASSDGLPERLDPDDQMMGYEKVATLFEQLARGSEALESIRAELFAAAEKWGSGRARGDDETVVLLRRRSR